MQQISFKVTQSTAKNTKLEVGSFAFLKSMQNINNRKETSLYLCRLFFFFLLNEPLPKWSSSPSKNRKTI